MQVLDSHKLEYEDMQPKKLNTARKAKKENNMSKTTESTKTPKTKYNKTRGEHVKDIVITTLIVGIMAFIGGMTFQSNQQEAINTAVKSVSVSTPVDAPVKK